MIRLGYTVICVFVKIEVKILTASSVKGRRQKYTIHVHMNE